MLEIIFATAPIFMLLPIGYLLRNKMGLNESFWQANSRLSYHLLIPSLLFYRISTANFDLKLVGGMSLAILGGFTASVIYSLLVQHYAHLSQATASSVMQGSVRHNMFVVLAIIDLLLGTEGVALAMVVPAMLIPTTNVVVVSLMVWMCSSANHYRTQAFKAIVRDLIRNPIILAVAAGVVCNLIADDIVLLHDVTRLLGATALPIMLLCVGASLQVKQVLQSVYAVFLASCGKMIIFPLVSYFIARWVGLGYIETLILVLFAAAPTAVSGYALAREMGGDSNSMAAIITLQTGISFITLPLTIVLIQQAFGVI